MKDQISHSLTQMQGAMADVDPTTGGLCRLYSLMPPPLKTHVSFKALLMSHFKLEVGNFWFKENAQRGVEFTLKADAPTEIDEWEMHNTYLAYVDDPYGDHPLGHARIKLIEDLIKRLDDEQ